MVELGQNTYVSVEKKEQKIHQIDIDGLKNCWHFFADQPAICFDENLLREMISWGIDINSKDINGNTPLFLQISQQVPISELKQCRENFLKNLIEIGLQIDDTDGNLNTAFLQFFQKEEHDNANLFLANGANINHKNKQKQSALILQFNKQDIKQLQQFLNMDKEDSLIKFRHKININIQDADGRNMMHLAMNKSLASIEASFDFQKLLISNGIDYNQEDDLGRVPLHYAFIKIGEPPSLSQIERDPIEIISNMLPLKGININKQDKWGKSPLHYAFQIGSIISASYFLQKGATINTQDVFGNYPLGTAILCKKWGLATAFIQNNPSQNNYIFDENYQWFDKKWKRDERNAKKKKNNK